MLAAYIPLKFVPYFKKLCNLYMHPPPTHTHNPTQPNPIRSNHPLQNPKTGRDKKVPHPHRNRRWKRIAPASSCAAGSLFCFCLFFFLHPKQVAVEFLVFLASWPFWAFRLAFFVLVTSSSSVVLFDLKIKTAARATRLTLE